MEASPERSCLAEKVMEGKANEQGRNQQTVCGSRFTQDPVYGLRTERRWGVFAGEAVSDKGRRIH